MTFDCSCERDRPRRTPLSREALLNGILATARGEEQQHFIAVDFLEHFDQVERYELIHCGLEVQVYGSERALDGSWSTADRRALIIGSVVMFCADLGLSLSSPATSFHIWHRVFFCILALTRCWKESSL